MKLLILGDLHGNTNVALNYINKAAEEKVELIIQLGDFGIWGGYSGIAYLDDLNYALQRTNRRILFVGGNHENYDLIESWEKLNPRSTNGHVYVRSNILYIPRGCVWKWGGKRFLGLGGAVSVDKSMRVPGESWWWQEAITNEQMYTAVQNVAGREIDYMFTHDCSDRTIWKDRIKPDEDSLANRKKIDWVLDRVKPKMQFHGHMHTWYDWKIDYSKPFSDEEGPYTQVYGLNMEGDRNAAGILDMDTNEFKQLPWKMPRYNLL